MPPHPHLPHPKRQFFKTVFLPGSILKFHFVLGGLLELMWPSQLDIVDFLIQCDLT